MRSLIILAVMVCGVAATHAAVGQKTVKKMSFEACLATIRMTSQNLGVAPTNIVETSGMRVVRMPAAQGSLLVTCNKAAGTMTLTPSTRTCGVDVAC